MVAWAGGQEGAMASTTSREMDATEARVRFGSLVHRVADRGERVIVERVGRPEVVALAIEEYQRLAVDGDPLGAWLRRVDELRERIRNELGGRSLPPVEEIIREGREEPVE